MFKIAKKQITRTGTSKMKVLFRVEVDKITFPKTKDLPVGSEVSVCFERGGKMATSYERTVQETSDGKLEIVFNETLSLVSTMYKSGDSNFQEKSGKLIVRQRKRAKIGSDTYKGLGVLQLSLDAVAAARHPLQIQSALQGPLAGGVVEAIITPRFIGEPIVHQGSRAEDSLMESVFSEASAEAADFDDHNVEPPHKPPVPSFAPASSSPNIPTINEHEDVPPDAPPPPVPTDDSTSSLSTKLTSAYTANAVVQKQLEASKQQVVLLQEQLEKRSAGLADLEAQIKQLTAEKQALESSAQDLFAVVDMNNSLKQELESERAKHESVLQQKDVELSALREQQSSTQDTVTDCLTKENKYLLTQNRGLEEDLVKERGALNEAIGQKTALEERIRVMESEVSELFCLKNELQEQVRVMSDKMKASTSAFNDILCTSLAKAETINRDLEMKNASLEEEIASLRAKVSPAKEGEEEKDTISRLQENIVEWELQYKTDASTIATLKREISDISKELSVLKAGQASENGENETIANYVQEVTTLRARLERISANSKDDAETINCLQQQLSEAAGTAEAGQKTITELQDQLRDAKNVISSQKEQICALTSSSEAAVATLNKQVEELTSAAAQSSATIESLQQQVLETTKRADELQVTIAALEQKNLELADSNADAAITIGDLKEQIVELTRASDEALVKWREQINELNEAAKESHATIDNLRGQIVQIRSAAEESERTVAALRKEARESEVKVEAETDEWKWKLADAIFKSEQAQEKLHKEHTHEVSKLKTENADLKITISTLEGQVETLEERIRGAGSSSEQEKAALELDAMKAKTVIETLRREVAKHEETVANLTSENAVVLESQTLAEESNRELRRDLDKARENIVIFEQRLSMISSEKDSILIMLSNVEAERDKLMETNEELGEKLSVEIDALKTYYEASITTMENEKRQLEREILQLQNDFDALKQLEQSPAINAEHEAEVSALRSEIDLLRAQQASSNNAEETAKIVELEEQVSKLKRKLDKQKEASAAEYSSLAETLLLAENDFTNIQQELNATKQQLIETSAERDVLKEEVRVLQKSSSNSDEYQAVVEELIEAKMQVAANAMEHDELRQKIQNYKRKVQVYAERIATMEVEAAEQGSVRENKLNAKEKIKKLFRKGEAK